VWVEFKRVAEAAPAYVTYKRFFGVELALVRRGLFFYSNYFADAARFNIAEPYGQLLAPRQPLRLDEAPEAVRDLLASRAYLDVSLASSPYVQPLELVPSAVWGRDSIYLASDGCTLRPIPGTEATAYRERAAALLRSGSLVDKSPFKPVVFDPPLDGESP